MQNRLFTAPLALLAFLSTSPLTSRGALRFEGICQSRLFSNGAPAQAAAVQFAVLTEGSAWTIEDLPISGDQARQTAGSAGGEVCNLLGRPADQSAEQGTKSRDNAAAFISPGPLPAGGRASSAILWYAFASGHYFKTVKGAHAWQFFPANDTSPLAVRRGIPMKGDWKLAGENYVFPSLLQGYNPGSSTIWANDGDRLFRPPVRVKLPAPYDRGYTNWIYRVLECGEFEGEKYPAKARLEYYVPRFQSATPHFDLSQEYMLQCTNVIITAERAGVPPLHGPVLISDLRFVRDRPAIAEFSYTSTSRWPSKAEVLLFPEYARQKALQARAQTSAQQNAQSSVPISSVLTSFLLPVLLISAAACFKPKLGSRDAPHVSDRLLSSL